MKQPLHLFLALLTLLFVGCGYDDSAIIDRIENLEQNQNTKIATINEQIEAINNSIASLEAAKTDLDQRIKDAQADADANAENIAKLQEAKVTLEERIATLQTYVDSELQSAKDWATATFATLEQYNALAEDVAQLNDVIDGLDEVLKNWVNEQLAGYYTIAEVDAMLEVLQKSVYENNESLQKDIEELSTKVDNMKAELTDAYTKAIEEAINTNNGVIDGKIAENITAVNKRIDEELVMINSRIAAIENRLDNIEEKLEDILARIQSITYIPRYADGNATLWHQGEIVDSYVEYDVLVTPKTATLSIVDNYENILSVKATTAISRAVDFIDMPIISCIADETNGVLTIKASGTNLPNEFLEGDIAINTIIFITDGNTDISSDIIPLIAIEQGNVISDNEIWYTTSDNQPVELYQTMGFSANIVSNTYDNERGVIVFDKDISAISEYAFYGCTKLTSIQIPSSVINIREYAFYECSNLISINISDNVTSIGGNAFSYCNSLTSVSTGNSVITIGGNAFSYCDNITSVTIGDSTTTIGGGAFRNCINLTSVVIGNSVETIGQSAFENCYSLKMVTIPDSTKTIGKDVFYDCNSLTSVTIGDGVMSIGNGAFRCNEILRNIYCKATIPPTADNYLFYVYGGVSGRKIYVPMESVEAYKTADSWADYANSIVGYDFDNGVVVE